MTPSPWLYAFLKDFEKFRPTAFKPTPKDVWTIAWGHTHGVKEGDTCTTVQGYLWLAEDVEYDVTGVNYLVTVPLTQEQFDALISLTYNIGIGVHDGKKGDFADSTLLVKLNAGDYVGAAAEFPKWNMQAGKVLPGLTTRRIAERLHFETARPAIAFA